MRPRRCCFLSMDSLDGYVSDDDLAIEPLTDLGWDVRTVSWRDELIDWNDFDVTVIRTTWDYQRYPDDFLAVLSVIDRSRSHLENSFDTVKWNLDKRYLQELEAEGIPVVPTLWNEKYREAVFGHWLERLETDEIIIKPTVSATAEHTYRLREYKKGLEAVFADRPFMVQPFMTAIVSEGEYSLFYFDGKFSHAILKKPKSEDFRVQEEHGGRISAVDPDSGLLNAGRTAAGYISPVPLYARVDLVRDKFDRFLVMELELIEPALYLRTDKESPHRFAWALTDRMDAIDRNEKI